MQKTIYATKKRIHKDTQTISLCDFASTVGGLSPDRKVGWVVTIIKVLSIISLVK
jgi:hypothetical protein